MFHRLSWRQTCGYLQLAFSCLLFHLPLSSLVVGAGTGGQGFCGPRSGFTFPSSLLPVSWISFGALWRLTRQEVCGFVGVSLQGPSGQVCNLIKHQKQSDINPPWGLLVWSRLKCQSYLQANIKVRHGFMNTQERWNCFWFVITDLTNITIHA